MRTRSKYAVGFIVGLFSTSLFAASVSEIEQNNTLATAQTIPDSAFTTAANINLQNDSFPSATISGDIDITSVSGGPNDIDFYCFHGPMDATLYLDIDTADAALFVDTVLSLFDPGGTLIAFDDDAFTGAGGAGSITGLDAFIGGFTLPATGTYCVAVTSYANFPNPLNSFGPPFLEFIGLSLGGSAIIGAAPDSTFSNNGFSTGDYVLHISISTVPFIIPSLSEWAMLILALVLGVAGFLILRQRGSGHSV